MYSNDLFLSFKIEINVIDVIRLLDHNGATFQPANYADHEYIKNIFQCLKSIDR